MNSKDELNRKSNKNIYVRNNVMTTIIKRYRGEKKRGIRPIDGFRKKLMIPDSEISKCPEFEVKSKIGKLLMNEKSFEEYSVKIYEIDPYFYEHHKEKIKVDKTACEYILFRTDVYFIECFLAVEIDEQNHASKDLIFGEKKRQEALKNNLTANLLELTQVMQIRVMIQIMKSVKYKYLLVNLKTKKRKENENKIKENDINIKELENEIKKINLNYQIKVY